jgi:hypothetical protein
MRARWIMGVMLACAALAAPAQAEDESHEPTLITVGAGGEWGLTDGESAYGPALGIETSPFGGWLEVEAAFQPMFRPHHTEWQTDLELQVPIDLAPSLEFNVGAGPEWTHDVGRHGTSDSFAFDTSLDFIYWPDRRIGLFFEPGYEYSFAADHDQSFTLSAGIAIPL